jgi:hypothetical protein
LELRNLISGGVAGIVAKSFVAPIDRIKILYQVSSAEFHLRNLPRVAYNIVRDEGLSALWKGNTATMIRVFPYSGIQFMVFDRIKTYMLHQHEQKRAMGDSRAWGLSPVESLVAGCTAGSISVVCTYPLDLTRAQLAVLKRRKHHVNMGFRQVLYQNYEHRGLVGLFRGCTPTLLGILPYAGIAYALNEQGKRKIHNVLGREPTTMEKMQCGAFSGLVAQTISYPLEVTRRRMQTIGILPSGQSAITELGVQETAGRPSSMVATMRLLFNEQGFRGMFKGVSMNWMKGPLAFSISFTVFDTVQTFVATDAERALRNPHRKVGEPSTKL